MVKLINIKRNDTTGECDIIPEDSLLVGHIEVDLLSETLKNYLLPEGYEWCVNHAYHAGRRLVQLLKNDEIPNEDLVMWY